MFGLQTVAAIRDGQAVRTATSVFGIAVEFDFEIDAGRVVFDARPGVGAGASASPLPALAESAE